MLDTLRSVVGVITDRLEPVFDVSEGQSPRVTTHQDDDFVVFVVGMRINAWWAVHRWLPVFTVAPRMVRELQQDADSGLLGSWQFISPPRTFGFVQYWESFESLRAYAHDSDHLHLEASRDYNREQSDGSVGIFHETYRVGEYETVYHNVPPRGLAAADGSELVSATGELQDAAGRLRSDGGGSPPEPADD